MPSMANAPVVAGRANRPVPPILFGTVLFLASELLFFGGLFGAYFALRSEASPWPPATADLGTTLPALATAVLVASSFTFHAAIAGGDRRDLGAFRRWILATFVLGAAFLGAQLWDYAHLDFQVASSAYGTLFYAMTGFHGLHVAAGLLLMLVILGRLAQGAYRDGDVDGARAISYYWHMVDGVWIALFLTLYVLR
jgi:cytochrome c oxidase subunit III